MCGHDWCSVRISKEIVEFASGKDSSYAWQKAKVSAALSDEQQSILEKRGVLSPDEIHRLASKTRQSMQTEETKASCHSDYVDADEARRLQDSSVQANH
jgi:phosphomethylpyrimidine synthase